VVSAALCAGGMPSARCRSWGGHRRRRREAWR
jgi:hypothetical protein